MRNLSRFLVLLLLASTAVAQGISGRWDGTAKVSDTLTVPVHLEITGSANHVEGAFLNGPQRSVSSEGSIRGNAITLKTSFLYKGLESELKKHILFILFIF